MLSNTDYAETVGVCKDNKCRGNVVETYRVYVNHDDRQGRHVDSTACEDCGKEYPEMSE